MRIVKLILLSSLIVNVALAVRYYSKPHVASSSAPTSARVASTREATTAEQWTQISKITTGNDAALVARLRTEGFPPAVVRAIVTAQVSERFSVQRRALQDASGEYAYWKGWSSINSSNPEARAALRKLYREQSDLQRQLLGDDALQPYEKSRYEQQYGDLSRDKIKQLEMITRDYQELNQQIRTEARGLLLPEDKEKLAYLSKEQKADIAAILSPAELEAYELRSSKTAQQLKSRLQLFDPTEQEYLALYKLQKAFDDRFDAGGAVSPFDAASSREERKARSEAQNQLTKDMEVLLGADRYKDYKITTDYDYRRVSQLAERLNLPATTARSVVELKIDTATRSNAIRADKSLDKEQRTAQLTALAQEVTTKLTQQLGTDGLSAYSESGGYWVKSIAPNTPTRIEAR